MIANTWMPVLIILSSMVPGIVIFLLSEERKLLRTSLNLTGVITTLLLVTVMVLGVYRKETYEARFAFLPNLDLVLQADPLSLFFAALSSVLWLLTTVYAIGYLEGSPHRSRFFGFFSLCVTATIGVATAGNLLTLILFYEMLTLTTYPLIVHRGTKEARRAGQSYLVYTLFGGAALLLGTLWLYHLTGTLEFTARGFVSTHTDETDTAALAAVFTLLITGFGVKAALVPLHGWLPKAMIAPAPVSALLHAVAVVKAGAFGIIRVVYEVFGIERAAMLGLTSPLAAVASLTIIYGSIRALFQDDLKRRLAFSTVSQVSYIILGVAIVGPVATIGGVVHLVHQGVMKITLFFCAGNLAETLGIHKISEMNGVSRRMPWTMTAFSIAAFGMIGMPPLAGFVSKWYLGLGGIKAGEEWVVAVLVLSTLLNAAYFLPILYRAWFLPAPKEWPREQIFGTHETKWTLLIPPVVTAALALGIGLFASSLFSPLAWVEMIAKREFY